MDALFRFAGLTVVAVIASWAVLATVELARRGTTDHATGLLNRASFFAALERERERALRERQVLSLVSTSTSTSSRCSCRAPTWWACSRCCTASSMPSTATVPASR